MKQSNRRFISESYLLVVLIGVGVVGITNTGKLDKKVTQINLVKHKSKEEN